MSIISGPKHEPFTSIYGRKNYAKLLDKIRYLVGDEE
jgi:hypothetical protein